MNMKISFGNRLNPVCMVQEIRFPQDNCVLSDTTDFTGIKDENKINESDHLKIIGKTLLNGDFQILDYIESGGIADVYLIRDNKGKYYAAKILKQGLHQKKHCERFLHEIDVLSKFINHPHILSLITFGNFDERPFIITELAEDGSLYSKLKGGNLTLGKALSYLGQASYGLQAVHEKGFVHRDIKPHNILIFNGLAKLGDFDLIKEISEHTSESDDSISGTINYISPEQTDPTNKKLNFKSDVYSLGITAFHVLTGRLPFRGNACEIIKQHTDTKPANPGDLNEYIPTEIQNIILVALSKKPENRPSALEFGECMLGVSNDSKYSLGSSLRLIEQ